MADLVRYNRNGPHTLIDGCGPRLRAHAVPGNVRSADCIALQLQISRRSGSAFAAEIRTKKVTEEVDALRTMAFDPVALLVAPKYLAMFVMMPCLTIWVDFMGVVDPCVLGVAGAGFTIGSYLQDTRNAIVVRDIDTGLWPIGCVVRSNAHVSRAPWPFGGNRSWVCSTASAYAT